MTNNELNHAATPAELSAINEALIALFSDPGNDELETDLNALIERRDAFVQQYLASLSSADARQFAELEYPVNEKLLQMVQSLLDSAKEDMTQFVRSQAAVKKYK